MHARRALARSCHQQGNHERTSQPHIGQLIQAQRHSLFEHVIRPPPSVPCNAILRLTQDISMGRLIAPGW